MALHYRLEQTPEGLRLENGCAVGFGVLVSDRLSAVVAPGETTPTLVVVSLKTGEHVADLGAAVDARCATDANTTIACRTDADTLVVYNLASRQVTKLHNPENVEAVGQDRLFVGDHSIDFTGKRVDQRLPGTPVELDLHQLVVRTDDAISAYPLSEK